MRPGSNHRRGAIAVASGFLAIGLAAAPGLADDPPAGGRLTRFFRFGATADSAAKPASASETSTAPSVIYTTPAPSATPPSTPDTTSNGPAPRIAAQPRTSRPATEADPLVTRVSVGRSDGGGQFGMFLEVFADGTVIDGEGIHHVGTEAIRPLVDALRQGDLYRVRGHCGNPSSDFIVTSHVVVYERSMGRLLAVSFSYSGNPHGCDASVHKLHTALESIQTKLSTPATPSNTPVATSTAPVPAGGTPVLELSAPK